MELTKNYADIVAATELDHVDEDAAGVNELGLEHSSIQQLDAASSYAEDIGTGNGSQGISIAFANLSTIGENQIVNKSAISQVPENVVEPFSEEQHHVEIVEEIDVESKGNLLIRQIPFTDLY